MCRIGRLCGRDWSGIWLCGLQLALLVVAKVQELVGVEIIIVIVFFVIICINGFLFSIGFQTIG